MNEGKNLFLTTLSETKNRMDVGYYMCDTPTGAPACTTGISIAEAGIKYILSQYVIDEIVIIGSGLSIPAGEERTFELSGLELSERGDVSSLSEYEFINYRITEFMDRLDFELVDINESIPNARKEELRHRILVFCNEYAKGLNELEFFSKLTSDERFEDCFVAELLSDLAPDEARWVKHQVYHLMDSSYKMHILEQNRHIQMRFISIPSEPTLSMDTINSIVSHTIRDAKTGVNLYMDIQGLGAIDGNTLLSTFLLMNSKTGYRCSVSGLINSRLPYGKFFGRVSNVIRNYQIQELITGLYHFLNYGRVNILKKYWRSLGMEDADADRLLYGMDCVDEGISLCNVDLIACGINVIRRTIRNPRTEEKDRSIYMQVIRNAISSDFGPLLDTDELFLPELLSWCLRKDLLQQTLTLIESRVPGDMVKSGIYYYARSKQDIQALMKEWNFLYWNETSKMRWAFGDIEHYFIKSYGRSYLDFGQKQDAIARDFARLKIDALHGEAGEVLRAYSELNNDDLLYELLLGYYRIGSLRNQVNHAVVEEPNLDAEELAERRDSRDELRVELKKFIDLYRAARKKTPKNDLPKLLPPGKMKAYARNHKLEPLAESTDLTAQNTYSCSFNGKEVLIRLSLFKPEPDAEVEEEEL